MPLNPNWIAGFVAADGSFSAYWQESNKSRIGGFVKQSFVLVQHSRDIQILEKVKTF